MPILDGLVLPRGWRISPRLLAAWPIDGEHSLELWPTALTADGRLRWRYRLSRKSRTVFTASDVSSAVGAMLTTEELIRTARTVLAFLTLCVGDTDAEYFDTYTRAQIAWRDRFAEELSIYAMDDVCGYCGAEHLSPGCPTRPLKA
ncbi:hypothetical protein GCM10010149_91670 [Nonomuraea roseoviolacea subsp. roseoviolacea]|uniref:hypothetical protein n=1 Tax=Nonomuraea roseoviolacea TaxID=103837 RepID=UPI0031D367DD